MIYVDPELQYEVICARECGCVVALDMRYPLRQSERDRKMLDCEACDKSFLVRCKSTIVATYPQGTNEQPATRWQ